LVVPGKPAIVVLPGPPRELQPMWRTAAASDPVREAIAGRTEYRQEMVRMFGLAESGLADTLRDAEEGIAGYDELEITTCLRRGDRDGHALRAARVVRVRGARRPSPRASWARDLLRGRLEHRR